MNKKKEERIREEKKKNILDHTSGRKKARNMLPCVAVHLGKAVQTARSGENERGENFF